MEIISVLALRGRMEQRSDEDGKQLLDKLIIKSLFLKLRWYIE